MNMMTTMVMMLHVVLMNVVCIQSFNTIAPSIINQINGIPSTNNRQSLSSYMVPKYINNEWVPQTEDDMPSAGYDVFGTFIRHGPKPTITRLLQPKDYEQAILKFMVTDQCNYITAQGNMDAYLRNPPDWQYQRLEDRKNGIEKQRDYVTIQIQDIILVLLWSTIVFAIIGRVIYSVTNGVDFVRIKTLIVCSFYRLFLSICETPFNLFIFFRFYTYSFIIANSMIGVLDHSEVVIKTHLNINSSIL
jgi:hypothetical protein